MSDASPSPENREFPRLGSYKILRQLGSGGMSNVFQAIHEESGSLVALKVLPRKLAQNATLLQRFLREARSAENLDHPNIVAIYDRGFDQGRHYLVLEFVDGRDLYDRVRLNGPMGAQEAVTFLRQVALGLEYAAAQGMIHRDVKPANLLLTPDGQAKIIDLGLALQADDEDERVTRDGTTVGTVDYMSPEQARDSRKLNERSDIYSLGCTLHYLLTGSPPFPGGHLADKLARHHSAPIPDVRDRNPAVPADLAALVRRMMAKKPDDRFASYGQLIEALDAVGTGRDPGATVSPGGPLPDVLIDDDDDDDSDDAIELTIAAPSPASPPASPSRSLKTGRPAPAGPAPPPARTSPEISLADLAALDADASAEAPRGRRRSNGGATKSPRSSAVVDAILEDEPEPAHPVAIRRGDELPMQTWIAAGVSVGLLVAAVAFGVRFALSFLDTPRPDQPPGATESAEAGGSRAQPLENEANAGTYPVAPRPRPPGPAARAPFELVGPPTPAGFHVKPVPRPTTEPTFAPDVLARLGFDRGDRPSLPEKAGKVVLRRLAQPGDPAQVATLAAAFGRGGDDVEIADVGPFHEDDCQLAGRSRVVRARSGVRPILMVQSTSQALIREQDAKFMLGLNGVERLLIEGIDLVADVRDLPPSQTTFFLCQGVDLTLRDCTVTVINGEDRYGGFSVFRLAQGPRPNRLHLDRTLVRGPVPILAQVVGGKAEIVLDRAVVLGSVGPLFQFEASDREGRSLAISRSVLACRGPVAGWGRTSPTVIRSVGSTFARVDSPAASPAFVARGTAPADVKTWLDYDGEANRWLGWWGLAQWGATGDGAGVRGAIQALRPGADATSQESRTPWPAKAIDEAATPARTAEIVPDEAPTLRLVAAPHPYLLELTTVLFPKLPTPGLTSQPGGLTTGPGRSVVALSFNPPTSGPDDLGLFLKAKVVDPAARYVVQVQGVGSHPTTPVRLPDGASVAILGPAGGPGAAVPVFVATEPGLALIELHRGDLTLANLGFTTDGASRPKHWLLVEDGLLAVRRCRYRDQATTEEPGSAAIAFLARGARPIEARAGGFDAATDRPLAKLEDCWIWTSGDAVLADLARGAVDLKNCLIIAGPAAFRLQPAGDPALLEADLILENCSVVDDRFGVALDPAAGPAANFVRPWLVVTRSSVFPRIARDGGALLGADPATFAAGGLFWQSSNDLYEVNRFLAPPTAPTSTNVSADLKRQWVDVWGLMHTRGDRGPDPRKPDRIIHFRDRDRPRTTRPTPSQLDLDPKLHSGQGVDFKSLPPIPKS